MQRLNDSPVIFAFCRQRRQVGKVGHVHVDMSAEDIATVCFREQAVQVCVADQLLDLNLAHFIQMVFNPIKACVVVPAHCGLLPVAALLLFPSFLCCKDKHLLRP